jgi:hypothetical protein
MKKNLIVIAFVAFCLATAFTAQADTITQWNFNNQTTTPSTGSGSLVLVGGVLDNSYSIETDLANTSTDPATSNYSYSTTNYPAQGTASKTAGAEFDVSTAGYESISIAFDIRTSNTSSKFYTLQYSIDGVNFINSGTDFTGKGDNWNNDKEVDLSSILGVNDNPYFKIRVVSEFDPANNTSYTPAKASSTYGQTSKYRFDMVTVSGVPVPEPSAIILLVAGFATGLGYLRMRRKYNG